MQLFSKLRPTSHTQNLDRWSAQTSQLGSWMSENGLLQGCHRERPMKYQVFSTFFQVFPGQITQLKMFMFVHTIIIGSDVCIEIIIKETFLGINNKHLSTGPIYMG